MDAVDHAITCDFPFTPRMGRLIELGSAYRKGKKN